MKVWSFYDLATGLFSSRRFIGKTSSVDSNTPEGFAAIEGEYDRSAQRVDLDTGQVVAIN